MSFDEFSIHPKCLSALAAQGIVKPTGVQREAIPIALTGADLIAVAQTGTGKTLGFALPSLTQLADGKRGRTRMIVLAPTRELAQQVEKVIGPMAKRLGMRSAAIFGGVGMHPQTRALRSGVDIVIATPGRLLDHIERGNTRFDSVSILVLDEADRMLEMGFMPDMKRIIGGLPKDRQTLLFSATFAKEIERLAANFQRDPQRIDVGVVTRPVETVRQGMYTVDSGRKLELLQKVLENPEVKSAIVFLRTKHRTDKVAKSLIKMGINAQPIHGGRSQNQRDRALDRFRNGKTHVLVATDVASRGIDISGVTHVVNFDVPGTFDDYVHRIGRTGRANESGDAITFVSPQDGKELGAIETALGKVLPRTEWEGSVSVRSTFGRNGNAQPNRARGKGKPFKRNGRNNRRRFAAARS